MLEKTKAVVGQVSLIIQALRKGYHTYDPFRYIPFAPSFSGVTSRSALTVPAFFRGLVYIADTIMTLPWQVVIVGSDDSRYPVRTSLSAVLNEAANREMSGKLWRSIMVGQALLDGVSYAEIARDAMGQAVALGLPIERGRVEEMRDADTGELFYRVHPLWQYQNSQVVDLPADRVFKLVGMWGGLSVIEYANRTLGTSIAQEENTKNFVTNGSKPSGVLQSQTALTLDKRGELATHTREQMSQENAFSVLVLQRGEEWKSISYNNRDSQFFELRQFSVNDIARFLGLPPNILMDYTSMKWANIEHANIEVVRSGLLPWCVRLETEANLKLVPDWQRPRVKTQINLEGLLRADTDTRMRAYATGRQWGWLSGNNVRSKENMPPIEGLDTFLVPSNMMEVADTRLRRPRLPSAPPSEPGARLAWDMIHLEQEHHKLEAQGEIKPMEARGTPEDTMKAMLRPQVREIWADALAREKNQIQQRIGKEGFDNWLEDWFLTKHQAYLNKRFEPIIQAARIAKGLEFEGAMALIFRGFLSQEISLRLARWQETLEAGVGPDQALDYSASLVEDTIKVLW